MAFEFPKLPYAEDALEPHISRQTLSFHHGKHHAAYVTNGNNLLKDSPLASKPIEEIVRAAAKDQALAGLFNNAAQVWNHTFFWSSMKPGGGGKASGALAAAIDRPGSREAEQALETCIEDRLGADPGLAAAAAGVLGRYYRQQLDCGDGQALAELGDLLWWDEPQLARAAFARAVEAGNSSALIRLAQHRWVVLQDYDGALPHYRQAIASPDPGVAAEALTGLGEAHRAHGELRIRNDVYERSQEYLAMHGGHARHSAGLGARLPVR